MNIAISGVLACREYDFCFYGLRTCSAIFLNNQGYRRFLENFVTTSGMKIFCKRRFCFEGKIAERLAVL